MNLLIFCLNHLSSKRCTLRLSVCEVSSYNTHGFVALEVELIFFIVCDTKKHLFVIN